MPVQQEDIKFYPSGTDSLGGAIDLAAEIPSGTLHAFFDAVSAGQSLSGSIEYRCFYVRNTSVDSDLTTSVAYIDTPPSALASSIELGAGTSGVNGTEQTIAQESDTPVGVSFQSAPDAGSGVTLADLTAGDYLAIWVKRIISSNTPSLAQDEFSITIVGETV